MVNRPTDAGQHAVYKTDELYHGPCRDHNPDVIINWDPKARVTTGCPRRLGPAAVNTPDMGLRLTRGNHRPNAFMAVVGPGWGLYFRGRAS
jgi:hypothetical protein